MFVYISKNMLIKIVIDMKYDFIYTHKYISLALHFNITYNLYVTNIDKKMKKYVNLENEMVYKVFFTRLNMHH